MLRHTPHNPVIAAKPTTYYTLTNPTKQHSIDGFRVVERWRGLVELEHVVHGRCVALERQPLGREGGVELVVISASPDLIDYLDLKEQRPDIDELRNLSREKLLGLLERHRVARPADVADWGHETLARLLWAYYVGAMQSEPQPYNIEGNQALQNILGRVKERAEADTTANSPIGEVFAAQFPDDADRDEHKGADPDAVPLRDLVGLTERIQQHFRPAVIIGLLHKYSYTPGTHATHQEMAKTLAHYWLTTGVDVEAELS